MDSPPTALFLTPESPFPPIGGGAMRSASILEYLRRHYAVDVIVFRQPGAEDPRPSLAREGIRRVTVLDLPVHARHTLARAGRNLRRYFQGIPPLNDRFAGFEPQIAEAVRGRHYQTAVVEHFWCAGYWRVLKPVASKLVLNLHNVESVLLDRSAGRAGAAPGWMMKRFGAASRRLERAWLPQYENLLVTSEADRRQILAIAGHPGIVVVPNAIPWRPAPARAEQDRIVFSGSLDYHPNIAAVDFFRKRCWPILRERFPVLEWWIAGRSPEAVRESIEGDSRIRATGFVDDVEPVLGSAKVAVVPLLSGSGTRVKILEAWAAATPVVSTPIGAEGLLGARGTEWLESGSAEGLVEHVGRLLESPALRTQIGQAGRQCYEANYTWQAVWRHLALTGL